MTSGREAAGAALSIRVMPSHHDRSDWTTCPNMCGNFISGSGRTRGVDVIIWIFSVDCVGAVLIGAAGHKVHVVGGARDIAPVGAVLEFTTL